MKLHIYLFRHGQTTFNRDKRFTGWKNPPLTKKGIQDAKTVAKKLKGKKIDVAFCSHTQRSKNTLKEVLKFHPECKTIIVNDAIIERSYGKLEGLTHASFAKKYGEAKLQIIRRSYDIPPPGGESVKQVEQRVNRFIRMLIAFMKKNKVNVAISAHGNSMRPFRKYFEKLSNKEMMKLENPWDDYFEYRIEV